MTDIVRQKNFLAVEGSRLASGEQHQITAAEWIYLYQQVKDELVGPQVGIFAKIEARIRNRFRKAELITVAV